MNKYLIAYQIWNKQDNIVPMLKGIYDFINPKKNDLLFIFDNCFDLSFDRFNKASNFLLNDFNINIINNKIEKFEVGCYNQALDFTYVNGYKGVFLFQDDMIIDQKSFTIPLIDNIGIIGYRDGFKNKGYEKMIGSFWSDPKEGKFRYLDTGETEKVFHVNFGPVYIPIETIKLIGKFDENLKAFYIDYDYCVRCNNKNLQNYVVGSSIIHEKIGNYKKSNVYNGEVSKKDLEYLKGKIYE